MPTWTTDEKTALANSNDGFSDAATWGVTTIYGVFLNEYIELDGVGVNSTSPAYITAASGVSGAKKTDAITINSVSYTVQVVKPDGAGLVTLVLKKT